MKYSLILALLALLSAGCGQKGPLYLPPPEAAGDSQNGADAEQGNKAAKQQSQSQKGAR
ncbi:LPS translocon maturation chaperone LptM [Methylogaea oryzae]|uniref:Lipoprotein n=1 Tax=Methylogaea oryzae TaxID=1295382 RepID=A0A8D4VTP0_9GAMM|nr:lipoprotein [Methylogaea oryzae]BBL72319.1 hypothetical protein MoryE10_29250 [Methylogaea oryzae]